ncbi:hypothetical protein SM434_19010 [Salmonella enterica]|nr:hypothetical protein [Salmonella enterica]MEA1754377.1 hypothetical protein [Salmonella enterica subsp. enterica serovar Minnesota]MDX9540794.1 hypothetical protein [Salmonella enterica]MDX9549801.1 hypothetical protein [Salmonella enterica]MDX9611283.1 hypothetical protein [Salmonella enterica]
MEIFIEVLSIHLKNKNDAGNKMIKVIKTDKQEASQKPNVSETNKLKNGIIKTYIIHKCIRYIEKDNSPSTRKKESEKNVLNTSFLTIDITIIIPPQKLTNGYTY